MRELRILIVEDGDASRRLFAMALEGEGLVLSPSDPKELHDHLSELRSSGNTVDVLVLDGELWPNSSWVTWRVSLREQLSPAGVVIGITSKFQNEMRTWWTAQGIGFKPMPKPIRGYDLRDAVVQYRSELEARQAARDEE